jgi:hypothetical protein
MDDQMNVIVFFFYFAWLGSNPEYESRDGLQLGSMVTRGHGVSIRRKIKNQTPSV